MSDEIEFETVEYNPEGSPDDIEVDVSDLSEKEIEELTTALRAFGKAFEAELEYYGVNGQLERMMQDPGEADENE